jgi:DNA ligase-1
VKPGLIPTFNVALAHDFTKVKNIDITDGTWFLSRKLDGVRCLTIVRDGTVRCFSRNGKEFETLGVVKEEIRRLGITDCVLDGEICVMKEDGSDDFQGILKEIQRKDHTIKLPRYWVFDILTLEEFDSGTGTVALSQRRVRKSFDSKILVTLPQSILKSAEELVYFRNTAKEKGWEGLIARRDVGYEGDRTKNMLKLKEFFDAEYRVVEAIMGAQRVIVEEREVEEIVLSAVIVEHKGNRVQVGSGFNMDERRRYFKNPEKIVGKIINVQYFESTVDQHGSYSLRFPVFKGVYGDSREI